MRNLSYSGVVEEMPFVRSVKGGMDKAPIPDITPGLYVKTLMGVKIQPEKN